MICQIRSGILRANLRVSFGKGINILPSNTVFTIEVAIDLFLIFLEIDLFLLT